MTCLVAWLAKDSNGASSAYLMSDSRITWGTPPIFTWPYGPKVVASAKQPVIVGYCGDSLFGAGSLIQAMTLIDAGNLSGSLTDSVVQIGELLAKSFGNFPAEVFNSLAQFVFCFRTGPMEFRFYELGFSASKSPVAREVFANEDSGLVGAWGSGSDAYDIEHKKWQKSDVGGYSRAIPGAFLDAIRSGGDPKTGDGPQIAGLYRKGPGVHHGIYFDTRRYIAGLEISEEALDQIAAPIEWRNEDFERCDPRTGKRLTGAQIQPRPRM
jgi:hypothetical protein